VTHTLHRRGTPENLANDYVVFAMSAKGINAVSYTHLTLPTSDLV